MMGRTIMVGLVIWGVALGARAQQETRYYAKCQEVINGHTLVVFHHNAFATIQLREAVCPEEPVAFWKEAKGCTQKLVEKRMCQVIVYEPADENEPAIGEIILPDGRYLSRVLIEMGWAWWNEPEGLLHLYAAKEKQAREKKLGMWGGRHGKPPWARKARLAPKKDADEHPQQP